MVLNTVSLKLSNAFIRFYILIIIFIDWSSSKLIYKFLLEIPLTWIVVKEFQKAWNLILCNFVWLSHYFYIVWFYILLIFLNINYFYSHIVIVCLQDKYRKCLEPFYNTLNSSVYMNYSPVFWCFYNSLHCSTLICPISKIGMHILLSTPWLYFAHPE